MRSRELKCPQCPDHSQPCTRTLWQDPIGEQPADGLDRWSTAMQINAGCRSACMNEGSSQGGSDGLQLDIRSLPKKSFIAEREKVFHFSNSVCIRTSVWVCVCECLCSRFSFYCHFSDFHKFCMMTSTTTTTNPRQTITNVVYISRLSCHEWLSVDTTVHLCVSICRNVLTQI